MEDDLVPSSQPRVEITDAAQSDDPPGGQPVNNTHVVQDASGLPSAPPDSQPYDDSSSVDQDVFGQPRRWPCASRQADSEPLRCQPHRQAQ